MRFKYVPHFLSNSIITITELYRNEILIDCVKNSFNCWELSYMRQSAAKVSIIKIIISK